MLLRRTITRWGSWAATLTAMLVLQTGSAMAQAPCPQCPCEDDLEPALCACNREPCNPPARPLWYVRADGVAFRRDAHSFVNLAQELNTNSAYSVLTTSQFTQPFEPGARIFIGHAFDGTRWDVEFSYFQLGQSEESLSRTDQVLNAFGTEGSMFSLFTNYGVPATRGLDYNYRVDVREVSHMDNGELNFRMIVPMPTDCPRLSFLVGIRHITTNEEFNYSSWSKVSSTAIVPAGATGSASAVSIRTHMINDLWGPQLGGLLEMFGDRNLWLNIEGKAALCDNGSSQDSAVTITNGGTTLQANPHDNPHTTAFVGDLAITAVARFTPHITGRFGYQAIWINGLGLAERNFAPSGGALLAGLSTVDRTGTLVYHGPTAGVEFTW